MIIRKSIWDENDLVGRSWTPWWAAFCTRFESDSEDNKGEALAEHNLKFYYGDGDGINIRNFAIEGDEKDIFEFIMRWS